MRALVETALKNHLIYLRAFLIFFPFCTPFYFCYRNDIILIAQSQMFFKKSKQMIEIEFFACFLNYLGFSNVMGGK